MTRGDVTRVLPFVLPVALVAIVYLALVAPRAGAGRRAETESSALRIRLAAVAENPTHPAPPGEVDTAMRAFERRIPDADRVPDLLEHLARLALDPAVGGDVRNLRIDTGERMEMPAVDGTPRVASGSNDLPDARLALFGSSLASSPVTVSFDASYAGLGRFLWALRDLPTGIEIRSLDMTRPARPLYETRFLHVKLVFFAFQRVRPGT